MARAEASVMAADAGEPSAGRRASATAAARFLCMGKTSPELQGENGTAEIIGRSNEYWLSVAQAQVIGHDESGPSTERHIRHFSGRQGMTRKAAPEGERAA